MFDQLEAAPPDAILGLTEAFRADPNPGKINLGVGVYKDESGRTPVLAAVKEAERVLVAEEDTKSYLPIGGDPAYGRHTQTLLFGAPLDRARSFHTPGGTGALRVAADFIARHQPGATIWTSSPTWANHKVVFAAAGVPVRDYPYYDPASHGVDEEGLLAALREVPAGDVVLLHVCCHNPTGVDLSPAQWRAVLAISGERGWTPLFDFAYQGFRDDVETDRAPLEAFAAAGREMMVANSFSKNFGLYRERTGGLTIVAETADAAARAGSQVLRTIRSNYSNPPSHGGAIVRTILDRGDLAAQWRDELAAMRGRIKAMRGALVDGLAARGADRDFGFINAQNGMFSFSGLSDAQVRFLRDRGIYIVGGGRINIAGVNPANVDALCDAVAEAIRTIVT